MMKFHNPYHFVPVKKEERREDISSESFRNGSLPSLPAHLTHDRFAAGAYSGRIVCRLTTEDPLFVGSSRKGETEPAVVEPYELGKMPAIPASTIRGLISSIAEAASNSAMRVLEDEMYSYRKTIDIDKDADEKEKEKHKPLSAIGMIVEINGQFRLRPLTLPVLEWSKDKNCWEISEIYKGIYQRPNLKVYIGDKDSIRKPDCPYRTYNHADKKFYYMKLHLPDKNPRRWNKDGTLTRDRWQYPERGKFLLAQKPLRDEEPLLKAEVPPRELSLYTRGIIRALGIYDADGNERKDIPENKHREIFIPYPEGVEYWSTIEIPQDVIDRFHDLADQRTNSKREDEPLQLPYEPVGTTRNSKPKNDEDHSFRLKDGDLVYFRPTGGLPNRVAEISLSSIWRGRVETIINDSSEAASSHSFFAQVDKELLPFNADRSVITLAEQLFGFVEEKEKKDEAAKDDKESLALASRLYPSPARLEGIRNTDDTDWEPDGKNNPYTCDRKNEGSWVTLKILSSPKPPSPAMYFKLADGKGGYIKKRELDPAKHQPQGRKFYLHRWPHDIADPWKSDPQQMKEPYRRAKQQVKVCPVKPRAVFYFHIDFENLSDLELGLLLYALRPSKEFRHKIGMGKALGLGRSRIEPVGLFRIDRIDRYSAAGLTAPRYGEVWRAGDSNAYPWTDDASLPDRYSREISAAGRPLTKSPHEIYSEFGDRMNAEIRHALELIGNPASLTAPVHTPLVANQKREDETFKWFVANDFGSGKRRKIEAKKKFLKPITIADDKIPTLDKHEWSDE